jgi:hypothetical protein
MPHLRHGDGHFVGAALLGRQRLGASPSQHIRIRTPLLQHAQHTALLLHRSRLGRRRLLRTHHLVLQSHHDGLVEAAPSELSAPPSELLASPSQLLASPSQLLAPPSELSASPSELSAPPSELLAPPSSLLASPSKAHLRGDNALPCLRQLTPCRLRLRRRRVHFLPRRSQVHLHAAGRWVIAATPTANRLVCRVSLATPMQSVAPLSVTHRELAARQPLELELQRARGELLLAVSHLRHCDS